jgi:lipopolysaccharide/colanic/teichoic acid biosynthesis glycosyltransferase
LLDVFGAATSPGPLLFKQRRMGLGGRPFQMLKFRTMIVNAEAQRSELLALNEQDGPAFKIKDDPRITRFGKFLRKSSIDELPQLWNVLRGEMSLVGPRPLPCFEAEACEPWQQRRHDVTPGLTCLWQVYGRSKCKFADWMRLDLRYLASRTLWRDIKLIVLTIPAVLWRKGAH